MVLECEHRSRAVQVAEHAYRQVEVADRLLDMVTAHAVWKDPERFAVRRCRRGELGRDNDGRVHIGYDATFPSAHPDLGREHRPTKRGVDDVRERQVNGHPIPVLDLDQDIERRRCLALEDRLLRAAAARLLIRKRDALDAPE